MLRFTKGEGIDLDLYQDLIYSTGYIYYNPDGYGGALKYEENRLKTLQSLTINEMLGDGGQGYSSLEDYSVINFLKNVHYVQDSQLKAKGVEKLSLNSKQVLTPLINDGIAVSFLTTYKEYKSKKSVYNTINKLPGRWIEAGDVDNFGKPINRITYNVSKKTNLRFNYKESDILAFPKSFSDRYTVPKDYFLVWGDMKQSDMRIAVNLMVIDETNFHYFDGENDWYWGIYRLLCDHFGRPVVDEDFWSQREDMKACILSAFYGAESGPTPSQDRIVKDFGSYLMTRAKYRAFRERIEEYIKKDYPLIINTYLGEDFLVTDTDKKGKKANSHVIRNRALNAPFQAGTSEVVIKTVTSIMTQFKSLGYDEDKVRVYIVRHDEPVFMVHKDVLDDMWVFENSTKIFIDSWRPLELEFSYGYNYGIEDNELTEKVNASMESKRYLCDIHEPSNEFVDHNPIKRIGELYLGKWELPGDKIMVTIIDPSTGTYLPVVNNSIKEDILGTPEEIGQVKTLANILERELFTFPKCDIINVAISQGSLAYSEKLEDGTAIHFSSDLNGNKADLLAGIRAYDYCKKNNLDFIGDLDAVLANKDSIDVYVRQSQ